MMLLMTFLLPAVAPLDRDFKKSRKQAAVLWRRAGSTEIPERPRHLWRFPAPDAFSSLLSSPRGSHRSAPAEVFMNSQIVGAGLDIWNHRGERQRNGLRRHRGTTEVNKVG